MDYEKMSKLCIKTFNPWIDNLLFLGIKPNKLQCIIDICCTFWKNGHWKSFQQTCFFSCRMEGSSKISQTSRPLTPVDVNKRSPVKQKAVTTTTPLNVSPPTPQVESPTVTPVHDEPKTEELQREQSKH